MSRERSKQEIAADLPEAPRTSHCRRRKNRRRWCKGREGIEHIPEIALSQIGRYRQERDGSIPCGWFESHRWMTTRSAGRVWRGTDRWHWSCWHETRCSTCGKILDDRGVGRRCPLYRPRDAATTTDR